MCDTHRRRFLAGSLALSAMAPMVMTQALAAAADPANPANVWVCPPCGCPDDMKEFPTQGRCPSCDMELIEKVKSKREAAAPNPSQSPETDATVPLK
jgi:rubrerythrin